MSEEDDWFERALRDLDEESDDDIDSESDDESDFRPDPFGGVTDETSDSDATAGDDTSAATAGSDEAGGGDGRGEAEGDRGSFGEDDPFVGATDTGRDEADPRDETNDRGARSGRDGPAAGGEAADPFGGYRNASPSDGDADPADEFGFADLGEGPEGRPADGSGRGGGTESVGFDVDPDEFESAIERTNVGIEGLDEMILGGIPSRSLLSVIGGAGTGKTTFSLQFLNEALESDGKGVYITLEQTRESIISTAEEKGWTFREYSDEGRLAVVAIDPIEMANSLASIRNDLTRLISEFNADRLVLDSVSLLEMMYDHPAERRSEVFGFTRSLKEAGVTTLLTSEASENNPYASRHGIVEYLADAVFVLQYIRGSDFRETRLAVDIQKIRDANHSRETKPYEITDTGISVYDQANIF